MKKYYHVCSLGLEKNLIFSNEDDFISGVNDIAICLLKFDLKVVCYCLMNNHFHFVLYAEEHDCHDFALEYKRRCGIRLRISKAEVNALQNLRIEINEIEDEEYLENAIAYVLRNPLAAKINIMPYHYQWSSAGMYFSGEVKHAGVKVNDMPERKRHRILKSKIQLPDSYVINDKGMILPESFVDAKITENIFRHPSRLMFALAKKVEPDVEFRFGIADRISYSDAELKTMVTQLIADEFGATSLSGLTNQQRVRLCAMMKRNFNASVKQISRITRVGVDIVNKLV